MMISGHGLNAVDDDSEVAQIDVRRPVDTYGTAKSFRI